MPSGAGTLQQGRALGLVANFQEDHPLAHGLDDARQVQADGPPLPPSLGDLWTWLQLMWLQFEAVRGPLGVVLGWIWGWFGALPQLAPNRPRTTPDRTSDNLKVQPHEL